MSTPPPAQISKTFSASNLFNDNAFNEMLSFSTTSAATNTQQPDGFFGSFDAFAGQSDPFGTKPSVNATQGFNDTFMSEFDPFSENVL
jgi:hypothetical protein